MQFKDKRKEKSKLCTSSQILKNIEHTNIKNKENVKPSSTCEHTSEVEASAKVLGVAETKSVPGPKPRRGTRTGNSRGKVNVESVCAKIIPSPEVLISQSNSYTSKRKNNPEKTQQPKDDAVTAADAADCKSLKKGRNCDIDQ